MSGKLELRLLGNPEIHLDGKPLSGFRSGKAQALLYYLVITRRAHQRSTLSGLFWGDTTDQYARRNLNRTLSNLRQLVGDHLTITRQTIAFDVESAYWLDLDAFESVDPNPDDMVQAVALYRGDFLEGFYVQDAPEFEQWVLTERARLRELVLHALHTLSEYRAAQGDLPQAIEAIRQILNVEPWREEAHRQLMLFLAQNGQRSAALTQFETCRQALAEELVVEPDPATIDLVERIRAGEFTTAGGNKTQITDKIPEPNNESVPSPPQTTLRSVPQSPISNLQSLPHNLPVQPTPFVGREQELTDIIARLRDPDCRLLTLIGSGGIGKTRLAIEAAQRLVDDERHKAFFANGIYFVALQPLNAASDIASTTAEAINLRFYGDASPEQQLLNFLRTKQMLLVLDNFEHLLEGADLISDILATAARVTVLVTSREELGLQEAWFHPIAGMSFPKTDADVEMLKAKFDAIQLFDQRARRAHATFSLAEEQKQVAHICRVVDGMPLGIELAAAWTRTLSCWEILSEIEQSLDFLSTSLRNVPERHRSLRALFE
ncbi:hypothetical protein KFU94_69400 [Chloroflexi bacterium TSY]|nr:hypothetical protein [Chloroflexi bacterium TSY]